MLGTSFILFLQKFQNPVFNIVSAILALLFSAYILPIVLIIIYSFINNKKILSAALATIPAVTVVYILKHVFKIIRPGLDIIPIELSRATGYSFPSGHAALSMAACIVLAYYYKKYRLYLITLVLITAISRVYLGVHYLNDVFVGMLIGGLSGVLIVNLKKPIERLQENINKAKAYLISK